MPKVDTPTVDSEQARPYRALDPDRVWRQLVKASFAVVGHLTPAGEPRSSGVVYTIMDRRMYVVVGAEGWKARHIAADGRVAVTVPIRRGGIMSLMFPIPPATISFHGSAVVYAPDSPDGQRVLARLTRLLPPGSGAGTRIVEIRPAGWFMTYGVNVPLLRMRTPALALARVPVR